MSRRSARPRFTLLLLVLTAITLLTLDERSGGIGVAGGLRDGARDVFAPVQDAADAAFRPIGDFFQGAVHYGDVEKENARLREQLAEHDGVVLQAEDAARERRALLDQQDLEFAGDIPTVAARVVVGPASSFDLTIQIDRGRSSGVGPGMPVAAGAGLVGRVVDVSRSRATILLITDPKSSVGVRLASSGDIGVAAGRGAQSTLRLDYIDPASKVDRGEAVVTSGLQQSAFPAGIPVGKVVAAESGAGALQQDVTVEPSVDLRRLAFVKVLQWSPPA
ncbi:MAG TPA: rod shape-determining protein MreC [Acidimicrobiales bacterium]|nr:rod shape-determining protein MreC [Acidimicrobiales bacterium]